MAGVGLQKQTYTADENGSHNVDVGGRVASEPVFMYSLPASIGKWLFHYKNWISYKNIYKWVISQLTRKPDLVTICLFREDRL